MISIVLLLLTINQYLCQSISGSSFVCGLGSKAAICDNEIVLRGQSHIGLPAACFQKVDTGPCSQDLVRIYYDSKTYSCKAFSYSGCGGNANRFVSVKNCYKLCHPYYRQRFISLRTDSTVTAKPLSLIEVTATAVYAVNASAALPSPSPAKVKVSQAQEANVEIVNYSSVYLNDTGNNTDTNKPMTNFSGLDSTEEPVEVQIVHEYDTYVPSLQFEPYSKLGIPAAVPLPFRFVPPYGFLAPGPQFRNRFLQNIQRADYQPVGGYIPTEERYLPRHIQSQVHYKNYK